jgi:hypothetical protein
MITERISTSARIYHCNISPESIQGIGFAHGEELRNERRGTLVPCADNFLVLVEPLLRLPHEGEGK